mgnify:FL=1
MDFRVKLWRPIFLLFTFTWLVCWLSIANADENVDLCIQAGGCRMSNGECGVEIVGAGCISFHEGACYQAGGTPSNGNCVFSDIDPDDCTAGGGTVDNGCTLYAVPEPTPLVLITIGLLVGLGFSKVRKRHQ